MPDEGGWSTIDSAPKDGDDFLAISEENGFAQVVYWDDERGDDWVWTVADGVTYHKNVFTHWMPLPPPPKDSHNERSEG